MRTKKGPAVQSIVKAAETLRALADSSHNSMSFKELEALIDLPRSTLHRILSTLEYVGFVSQDRDSRRYRLGSGILQVAGQFLSGMSVVEIARPFLEQLARDCDETVNLGILDFPYVVYLDVVQGRKLTRSNVLIGTKVYCHCTALGKVLLASSKNVDVESLAAEPGLPALTPRTITSMDQFLSELALVRGQGYAVDDEELEMGLRCVAAPVHDHTGTVVAAISVSGSTQRLKSEQLDSAVRFLKNTASAIGTELGYSM